ncbi:MAG TPA: hypothetical protein VFF30_08095 [Nitrososphaerales archaeon]|nr:hypothetical protein [Nitrososphaerales archaeon]
MEITDDETWQIRRLSNSTSVRNLSEAIHKSLDEETISRIISSYLYFKSNGRPDKDFAAYLGTNELRNTLAIALNVIGAMLPALIFDKEFRVLAMKTGLNKGIEIGSKMTEGKVAEAPTKGRT